MATTLEPFRRGEPSRAVETGGAELGFAIARDAIRAHGGALALENRPSGGLGAIATLPMDGRQDAVSVRGAG